MESRCRFKVSLMRCSFRLLYLLVFTNVHRISASTTGAQGVNASTPDPIPACEKDTSWFHYVLNHAASTFHTMVGRVRHQFGDTVGAARSLTASVTADPCNAKILFDLASLRYNLGDADGAEQAFKATLEVQPDHQLAGLHLVAYKLRRGQAQFWGHLYVAIAERPSLRLDADNWHSLKVKDVGEKAFAHLQEVRNTLKEHSPLLLAMNAPPVIVVDLPSILRNEATEFKKACQAAVKKGHKIAKRLPDALSAIRAMENTSSWLVPWASERIRKYGDPRTKSAGDYGTTWLAAWNTVMQNEDVSEQLYVQAENRTVVIVGSGLGYQCLFAIAFGASRCIGYELLCDSMVKPGAAIIAEYGLSDAIQFRCADARSMTEISEASLLWINDASYSPELSSELVRLAEEDLPTGSVAVVFNAPSEDSWRTRNLPTVDVKKVMVSWRVAQLLYILLKDSSRGHSPGGRPGGRQAEARKSKRRRRKRGGMEL